MEVDGDDHDEDEEDLKHALKRMKKNAFTMFADLRKGRVVKTFVEDEVGGIYGTFCFRLWDRALK